MNCVFKDDINTFRANISESSVARCSQAIGPMMDMLKAVDTMVQVKTPSGQHSGPNLKLDFDAILKLLVNGYSRPKMAVNTSTFLAL